MAKDNVADWDTTAANNTDVGGISIAGTAPPSNIDNGIREIMAQIRSDVPILATPNTFTKTQKWAKGADVASATALTLGDDGNYFDITGTTAITSIATKGVGTAVRLHFDAALTLTHNATDLVLPGGANITTAAGDEAEFVEYATGDWRCVSYSRNISTPNFVIDVTSAVSAIVIPIPPGATSVRLTGQVKTSSTSATTILRVSIDGGSTYLAGSLYEEALSMISGDSTISAGASAPGSATVFSLANNSALLGSQVNFSLDGRSGDYPRFRNELTALSGLGSPYSYESSGYVNTGGTLPTHIQISATSGNIAVGTRIHGMAF